MTFGRILSPESGDTKITIRARVKVEAVLAGVLAR